MITKSCMPKKSVYKNADIFIFFIKIFLCCEIFNKYMQLHCFSSFMILSNFVFKAGSVFQKAMLLYSFFIGFLCSSWPYCSAFNIIATVVQSVFIIKNCHFL